MTTAKSLDDVTGEIVDAAYKLHTGLGPGLLESVYETVLARDLQRRGLQILYDFEPSASPRLRVNQESGVSQTGARGGAESAEGDY